MGDLNTRLQQTKGIQLAVRLGIHTGLVVVGEMGGAGRQEQLALGEVPNIASRIEGLAAPNTIAISEATYRLIQGYFECQDLGAQTLRGVTEPLHVYRVFQREWCHTVDSMWLRPEDSRRWWVENKKSVYSWNVGSKSKLDKGRWSYSRVMQALGRVVWSKCSRSMSPTNRMYAGNVGVRSTLRTRHCFLSTDLFQRLLRFQAEEPLTRNWGNSNRR